MAPFFLCFFIYFICNQNIHFYFAPQTIKRVLSSRPEESLSLFRTLELGRFYRRITYENIENGKWKLENRKWKLEIGNWKKPQHF